MIDKDAQIKLLISDLEEAGRRIEEQDCEWIELRSEVSTLKKIIADEIETVSARQCKHDSVTYYRNGIGECDECGDRLG